MSLTWIATEQALSPALLTVQVQELDPTDKGQLMWDMFFPRQDVDSVDLDSITTLDYRPSADHREWDARGRLVPLPVPTRRKVSMVPIEARSSIGEYETQYIQRQAGENSAKFRELVGVSLSDRANMLAMADYRRLEIATIQAWTTGTIIQRNPENASQTYTASFGISATRITTAVTAWNDAGVNAYDLFLAWVAAGRALIGEAEGAMMRETTFAAILADAPALPNAVEMTRSAIEQRIAEDLGQSFTIYINENSVDVFTDGGTDYTRTDLWPAQTVALIPKGKVVGQNCFAPITRARDLNGVVGANNRIDVNSVAVFHEVHNGGRQLDIEAQLNAVPVPDESKVYVINAGV